MRRFAVVLALVTCALGCRQILGFESPAVGDDAPIDTNLPPPDGGVCTEIAASCVDQQTLRTCNVVGAMSFDTACAFGCVAAGDAHCGVMQPAGGGVTEADLDPTGLVDVNFDGGTIDGDAGTMTGVANVDYHLSNNVAVFRFKTLVVNGPTTLAGSHPIALVASGTILVEDVIDARGTCNTNLAGPGGFPGGPVGGAGAGVGGGGAGTTSSGGGGGGNGGVGGVGGSTGGAGAAGGVSFGDPTIMTLAGGAGGGGGTGQSINVGGGGGGAIQLVSLVEVFVNNSGGINAGGCGAPAQNCPTCNYPGGGAGGTILLEGRQLIVAGSLAVNGGGGGGAGGGGNDATLDRNAAAGGAASNGGPGGIGAAAAVIDGAAAPNNVTRVGGGGGAAGRIRLNSAGNTGLTTGGVMSPDLADAPTTTTRGAIGVR